jgi:hypothetical protein
MSIKDPLKGLLYQRCFLSLHRPIVPTGFDKGVMTHVDSFKEYVDDLETFVTKEVVPRSRSVKVEGNGHLIYVANSMAGKC